MDEDLSSLSVDELLSLKQQATAAPTPTVAEVNPMEAITAQSDLSALSVDELLALKNSSTTRDWNIIDSAKNFGSGLVEGTAGMMGLAADLNPFGHTPDLNFSNTKAINQAIDPYLAEKDPQYRYARTIGNFAAPVPVKGANTLGSLLMSVISGTGAQVAEDATGDKKIAPLLGAVATGGAASLTKDAFGLLKRALWGASKDEIKGSAAKAFRDATGLTVDDLSAVNKAPVNTLEALQTTAERTGNAGVAQLEKTLGALPENAGIYNNLDNQRALAREGILDAGSTVKEVNKEALGDTLVKTAEDVQGKMKQNSRAFWEGIPRDEIIPIDDAQKTLQGIFEAKQAGLPPSAQVVDLARQVMDQPAAIFTSGGLQDIRSDALKLLREKNNLTSFEIKVLEGLRDSVDSSMAKGLSEKSYELWKAARQATAAEKEAFKRGTAGGYLTSDNARISTVLDKVFKGDKQSVTELKSAIGDSPEVLEQVKRGILDSIPRRANDELTAAGVKKFLKSNESGLKELFGDSYYKNLDAIAEDLKSQASVSEKAFLASKGGSTTAQKTTVAGAMQQLITESLTPGTGGVFAGVIDAIKQGAGIRDAKGVEKLLFEAALDPKFAEELVKAPSTKRILNAFESLKNAGANLLTTGALVSSKELSREQDNRTTTAKLLDKVLSKKIDQKLNDSSSNSVPSEDMARTLDFDVKLNKIATNLDANPQHLLKAIAFETGGTFDPAVKNKAGSGATGLIQFMPKTAKELTQADTKEAAIKILSGMTAVEQLDYVEKYLKPFKGKLNSVEDVYMAILWPKAVGKDSDYALFKEGTTAYWQNRGLDLDKDGVITKAEAATKVKNYQV